MFQKNHDTQNLNSVQNRTESYRFGFNGVESDDEVTGSFGNTYTTMFTHYDARLGRWWSIDPKTHVVLFESPYNSMHNNPVIFADPKGDLPWLIPFIIFLTAPDIAVAPTFNGDDLEAIEKARSLQSNWICLGFFSGAPVASLGKSFLKAVAFQATVNGVLFTGKEAYHAYTENRKIDVLNNILFETPKSIGIFDAYTYVFKIRKFSKAIINASVDINLLSDEEIKILGINKDGASFTVDMAFNLISLKFASGTIPNQSWSNTAKKLLNLVDETIQTELNNQINNSLSDEEKKELEERKKY